MTNHEPATGTEDSTRVAHIQPGWLLCPDCSSVLYEIWDATAQTLAIEVAHSDPCPRWPHPEQRQVVLAFLPPEEGDDQ